MSRMRLAVLLAFVFACTDQNEPIDPPVTDGPDEITLEDDASGIELELDFAESRNEAHTALRARTVLEAVLWHGGEAKGARDKVKRLARRDREAPDRVSPVALMTGLCPWITRRRP